MRHAAASALGAVMVSLALGWPGVSAAGRRSFGSSPAAPGPVPGQIQKAGVSVIVSVLDAEQTRDIFDVDLIRKGVQPVLIKIHNDSATAYRFSKSDVDAHYIPAAAAAWKAYENPLLVGGKVIGRAIISIPGWFVDPQSKTQPKPLLNRDIQQSFVREEIADAQIGPQGSLAGFLYLPRLAPGAHIRVPLSNAQTQEPLVFDVTMPVGP